MSFAMMFTAHNIVILRAGMAAENELESGSKWCRQLPYPTP